MGQSTSTGRRLANAARSASGGSDSSADRGPLSGRSSPWTRLSGFWGRLSRLSIVPGLAEYRAIADHVLLTIQQQRLRILTAVVEAGEPLAAADRFRRRCERWADPLSIGPTLVRFGTSGFAYDARRSWEFGEDFDMDPTAEMMHRIVQPTLRSAFRADSPTCR